MRISDWSSDVCSSDLLVRRRHLEADMQEAKSARLEDLRAVGAAIEAVHIPGLLLEEGRVRTEHRVPVLEAAISEHAVGKSVLALGIAGIGPVGIIVMIAGDDGEGKLAGNHFIALGPRRNLDR